MKNAGAMYANAVPNIVEQTKDALLQTNLNYQKDLNEVAVIVAQKLAGREKEIGEGMAKIYASEFTEQELKDLVTFYKSPLGQKLLAAEPRAIQYSMAYMNQWAQQFRRDGQRRVPRRDAQARQADLKHAERMREVAISQMDMRSLPLAITIGMRHSRDRGADMAEFDVDLFVIGGGSGGVRAARIAAGHGARVMVAEEYRMGGTCVIRGCVPKKLFVIGSHIHHEIEDAAGFGWTIPQATFDWPTLIANKDKEIARLEGIYTTNVEKSGARIVKTRAVFEDAHTLRLGERRDGHGEIRADRDRRRAQSRRRRFPASST